MHIAIMISEVSLLIVSSSLLFVIFLLWNFAVLSMDQVFMFLNLFAAAIIGNSYTKNLPSQIWPKQSIHVLVMALK